VGLGDGDGDGDAEGRARKTFSFRACVERLQYMWIFRLTLVEWRSLLQVTAQHHGVWGMK
jgi:hypothetical protein